MCTAATYMTKDLYFGRTFDYEFSYGEEAVVTPGNYEFAFRKMILKVLMKLREKSLLHW